MQSRQDISFAEQNQVLNLGLSLQMFGCLVQTHLFCIKVVIKDYLSLHERGTLLRNWTKFLAISTNEDLGQFLGNLNRCPCLFTILFTTQQQKSPVDPAFRNRGVTV